MTTRLITTTISLDYLPEWTLREALRELVQNWLDEADATGCAGTHDYSGRSRKLVLRNPGASITRDALLLGVTSKADGNARGIFGEGLKLAALVLARSGAKLVVRTAYERWAATAASDKRFGARRVLAWRITETERQEVDGVEIEVRPIPREAWDDARQKVLALTPPSHEYKCAWGRLLLDPSLKGHVYAKGLWVTQDESLAYGYDLALGKTDRDRKLVDPWVLQVDTARIALAGFRGGAIAEAAFERLLEAGGNDARSVGWQIEAPERTRLAAHLRRRYGEDIAVAASREEQTRLESLGGHAVVLPKYLAEAVAGALPTAREEAERLATAPRELVQEASLDLAEWSALRWATGEVEAVLEVPLAVSVVHFRDEKTVGAWRPGNQIEVARSVLSDPAVTLATLVHEAAHVLGADGALLHVAVIEELWTRLVRRWALTPRG